jgi:hypothetical protein
LTYIQTNVLITEVRFTKLEVISYSSVIKTTDDGGGDEGHVQVPAGRNRTAGSGTIGSPLQSALGGSVDASLEAPRNGGVNERVLDERVGLNGGASGVLLDDFGVNVGHEVARGGGVKVQNVVDATRGENEGCQVGPEIAQCKVTCFAGKHKIRKYARPGESSGLVAQVEDGRSTSNKETTYEAKIEGEI